MKQEASRVFVKVEGNLFGKFMWDLCDFMNIIEIKSGKE